MNSIKRIGLIITCVVGSVILITVATQLIQTNKSEEYSYSSVTSPKKISVEELKKLKQDTGAIYNEYGEFRRVSSEQSFKPSEIAYDDDSVNEQTKQLILEYGIFVKVGEK